MISPEVLTEQIMGYVVGAGELIPTLKPPVQTYDIAILPQGPHFYTGLLRAAGYLLLDNQKKKILFFSQSDEHPDRIIVEYSKYESLGKQRMSDKKQIKKITDSIGADIAIKGEISKHITNQLPFLAVIRDIEDIMHVSIGKDIPKTKIKEIISLITHHRKEYAIILLTNIALAPNTKKINEQDRIIKAIGRSDNRLIEIFHKTLGFQKKKPEIVAYVNPGDFERTGNNDVRYVCTMA